MKLSRDVWGIRSQRIAFIVTSLHMQRIYLQTKINYLFVNTFILPSTYIYDHMALKSKTL